MKITLRSVTDILHRQRLPRSTSRPCKCLAMLTGLLLLASLPASAAGTWHALASRAPDAIDTMMLLPDGTVMAAQAGNGQGTHWYKLTPDATGSYINGTWSSRAAMHDTRLYYSSAVLQDGRVFIAGGEYGSGGGTAEMYDPQADTWTQLPNSHQFFSDSGCVMLADGNVLVAPVQPNPLGTTIIYNVKSNSWSAPIPLIRGVYQDEASWVKLPDDSILTIDPFGFKSERFIPSLNQWVNDSDVPVTLYDPYLFELGAAFLLPNGNAFYLGSVSNTAIYTPSGNSSPGVWTRGPDIPDGMGAPDAPAAMMVNGKILCALSQAPITNDFPSPTSFYEYDSSTNGFAQITGPLGQTLPIPAFILRMVCLPDGSVLVSASDDQLYIYQPDGTPLAQGKPTISGISVNPDGSYHVAGTGFNGLSQGASYGDDAQMDSNYPLVRFTDRSGNVFYGRTFNWSSTGVRTGTSPVSTDFVTAPGMPAGVYSLVVVGNGFASDPINFAPVQPLLSVVTNSISGGNGNGQIDYNECNDFNVTITNQGAGLATHVRGTISVNTPFAHAGVRTIDFHDLPPGTGASTLTPFKISTEPGFVCGTPVDVTLVLSSDQTVVTNAIRLSSGVLGTPVRFDNSTLTNIPDGDPIGLMSPITVSNFNSAVAKVTVSTFIVHPFDADLRMELIAPDGTSVLLSDLNGGNGQNYGTSCFPDSSRTTFDDGASNSITAGIPPFTGSYKPMQALAVFNGRNGTNINGTWKLHVIDRFQFDVGFLSCWSLQLTPYQCVDGGGECPGSDLSVTLSAFPNPALISSNITFTMVVSNAGPSSAKAVVVNQTLPTNFVYITGSASQGSVGYLPGMVSANLGNLGVNASAVVTVTALSVTNGTFTTVATVGAPTTDIDTSNNSASLNVRVEKPTADIAVTMTAAPNPVLAGGTLTYTMVVTNNGPFTATGVVLTNILPSNVVFISSSTTQGTFANSAAGILTLLGDIAAGSNATVTIAVSPGAVGIFNASAQVAADSFIFDPVTGNNHASVSTTVNPAADLEITMAANPANVLLNSNFSYTITVVNHGPSLAQSVQMSQSFQGGLTILSNTISAGTITNQGGAVTANIGTMQPGAVVTAVVYAKAPALPTTILSVASVSSVQNDPNNVNNTFVLRTPVRQPFISIVGAGANLTSESIAPPNGTIDIGETVTLQLRLQNQGNITASSVTATLLPGNGVSSPSGQQSYGAIGVNAIGSAPFTFTATGTNGGTVTATLQVQNNGTNVGTINYAFALPNTTVFSNSAGITIFDATASGPRAASVYPSTIQVSGITGFVSRVAVTLAGLSHTFPQDIGTLVVHPTGRKSILMAHAGGDIPVSNINPVFDSAASTIIPSGDQLISTHYLPASYTPGYVFPTNAPAPPVGPYDANLGAFGAANPNGSWSLYVADDSTGDSGSIAGGWSIAITTAQPVNPLVELAVTAGLNPATPTSILVGDNVTFQLGVKNEGPAGATGVKMTNVLSAGLSLVSVSGPPQSTYTTNGQTIVFTLPQLALGSNVIFSVTAKATAVGTQTDAVSIGGNEIDVNLGNNTAAPSVNVTLPFADLGLSATASGNPLTIGNNLVYTIGVTNRGPNAALNATLTDTLPAGFSYVSSTASQGTAGVSGNVVTIAFGNMAPNTAATATITVAPTIAGLFTNTIAVASGSSDSNTADNSVAIAATVLQPVPVIVAKGIRLIYEGGTQNGAVDLNEFVVVEITLANVGTAATTNLETLIVTNGGVVPYLGYQVLGSIAPGASVTATYSFTGTQPPGGTNVLTMVLADGIFYPPPVTFSFIVPSSNSFTNGVGVTIPSSGPASPYPSTITISNVPGVVSKAVLKLSKVTHTFPNDVNVLLVSPTGQSVIAMAHCGGAHSMTNVDITLDDAAATYLSAAQIASGTYKPSAYSPIPSFPAFSGTPSTTLSALNGSTANGTWSLYVLDDAAGNSGSIGGWSLTLTVANTVNPAAALSMTMTGNPASLLTGNLVDYVVTIDNAGPAPATNVVIADTLPIGMSLVSASIASGTTDVSGNTLNCRLPSLASGSSAVAFIRVQAAASGAMTNSATVSADVSDLYTNNNTALFVSTVTQAANAQLTGTYASGTGFQLTLTGQNGEPYIVQYSTNLSNWVSISTNTPVGGTFTIPDSAATGSSIRYYRAFRMPH